MSRRNNFDLRCAQDVFKLNRDTDFPEPPPASRQPNAVARRRGGVVTRVTPNPPAPPIKPAWPRLGEVR